MMSEESIPRIDKYYTEEEAAEYCELSPMEFGNLDFDKIRAEYSRNVPTVKEPGQLDFPDSPQNKASYRQSDLDQIKKYLKEKKSGG
jgi:hypothetical protein